MQEIAVEAAVGSVDTIADALKQVATTSQSGDQTRAADVATRADLLAQAVSSSVLASADVAAAAGADDDATEEIKEVAENIEHIGSAVGEVATSVDSVTGALGSFLAKPTEVVDNLVDLSSAVSGAARATGELVESVGVDAEAAKTVEDAAAAAAKAASLAGGLVGALRGEDTEVKAAVKDAADLGGQLVSALVSRDVEGLRDVVGSVGDRAQKLEALAEDLGCGESVGALASSVATVSNIITADHAKSAAVVGQAASDVGSALFGVLSAVGTAVVGGGDVSDDADGGGKSGFANVISASGDAARAIGESIGTVANLTDELGGENNVISNTIREMSEVNAAVGEVLSATGKAVAKVASGEATAADVVALGADCLAGATHGVVAVAGSVVNEMNMAAGAVKLSANLCKAGFAVAGHFAKSAGLHAGAVDAVVGVVGVAADTVGVAAGSVSDVLQATHEAVGAAGEMVSAAGKAAVRVTEEGDGEASVTDVLSGLVNGARESDANIGEAVSGVTGATGAALENALEVTSNVADAIGLTAVGNAVGGLFGFGSRSDEEGSDEKHEENEEAVTEAENKFSQDDVGSQLVGEGPMSFGNFSTEVAA